MKKTRRPFVLASVMLAMFMAAVEATIVATAMPSIVGDLGGFSLFSWVFSAFLLTQAVTIPIYGKFADLFGRKSVFSIGVVIFLAGSILCGLAGSMELLILYRMVQGIGAGAVMPIATTIVGDIYTMEERAKVQGYLASVWGFSSIVGPLLGGFFVQYTHWAWVFWINIPLGLLAILGVVFFLHEHIEVKKHRIDYIGSALLFLSISALMIALTQGGVSWKWTSGPSILLIVVFLACFASFLFQERRAEEPMMPLGLWKNRMICVANLASLTTGAIIIGISGYLPAFVQGVMGQTPIVAGFTISMMSIGWPLAATYSGRVMMKWGARTLSIAGGFFLILGGLFFITLNQNNGIVWGGIGSFLSGVGLGLATTTFIVSIQSSVDWKTRGVATASNMFMRILGNTVGVALLGGVLNSQMSAYLASQGSEAARSLNMDVIHLLLNPEASRISKDTLAVLREGLTVGLHSVYWGVFILALLSFLLILYLPKNTPETSGQQNPRSDKTETASAK